MIYWRALIREDSRCRPRQFVQDFRLDRDHPPLVVRIVGAIDLDLDSEMPDCCTLLFIVGSLVVPFEFCAPPEKLIGLALHMLCLLGRRYEHDRVVLSVGERYA